jgi:hypothetical protein
VVAASLHALIGLLATVSSALTPEAPTSPPPLQQQAADALLHVAELPSRPGFHKAALGAASPLVRAAAYRWVAHAQA